MLPYIVFGVLILFFLTGIFVVKQQTAAVIERFGKFLAIQAIWAYISKFH
jgi:regulator of protease activity HflC (stomatin/prohibitin superfamily)